MFAITCLMVSGEPMTDEASSALLAGARRLRQEASSRCCGKVHEYVGDTWVSVESKGEFATVGCLAGYVFDGVTDHVSGKATKARFLVSEEELLQPSLDGMWIGTTSGRAAKACYN